MNWHGVGDFIAMGGYGVYVWGAYGMTAAGLLIETILASRRHRRALAASTSLAMRGETILDASR